LVTSNPTPHRDAVDKAGTFDVYHLVQDARLQDLAGKLLIDWGSGTRAWVQRAESNGGKRQANVGLTLTIEV
jgi:hypothetical protein